MLKREITYIDLDKKQVTETFYFNLFEAEFIEYESNYPGGMHATIQRIIAAENTKDLIAEFKKIILMSYGKREGNRFIKTQEMRDEFEQTPAYSKLFMELATNEKLASEFMLGIIPENMQEKNVALPAPTVEEILTGKIPNA
jgi:hypothetical protein